MKHFRYPIALEHAFEFCRPERRGCFIAPFKWGENWGAANGFLAIRIRTFLDCDRESPEAVSRVETLPWRFFLDEAKQADPKLWGKLDDRRGGLWRAGEREFWDRTARNSTRVTEPRINVGAGMVQVTLPTVQLISKLPRAEVFTGHADMLFFRFNGGEGLAVPFPRHDRGTAAFSIFAPSHDPFSR